MVSLNRHTTALAPLALIWVAGLAAAASFQDVSLKEERSVVREAARSDESDEQLGSLITGFQGSIQLDTSSSYITAGELWEYFNNKGITSVDRLTFSFDSSDSLLDGSLGSLRFQIEDPGTGAFLTNISVQGKSKLEIPLNYDYMQRFSADSQELIRLELPVDGSKLNGAAVSIDADSRVFSRLNLILVGGFVGFWLGMFYLLNRFTKPLEEESEDIRVFSQGREFESPETSVATASVSVAPAEAQEVAEDRKIKTVMPANEDGVVKTEIYSAR